MDVTSGLAPGIESHQINRESGLVSLPPELVVRTGQAVSPIDLSAINLCSRRSVLVL